MSQTNIPQLWGKQTGFFFAGQTRMPMLQYRWTCLMKAHDDGGGINGSDDDENGNNEDDEENIEEDDDNNDADEFLFGFQPSETAFFHNFVWLQVEIRGRI